MTENTVLIIGASRGLGLALAEEYLRRGWQVTATVRGSSRTALHELAEASKGRLVVETADITMPEQVSSLRERLSGTQFGLLCVNAGITNGDVDITEVSTETFTEVMVTNALSPVRVVEALRELVLPQGAIVVMSSRQGSIALNDRGGYEVYRASKSALNQLMRSYAARHADDPRTLVLMSPGWVRTSLGGPAAPLTIRESIPGVIDTIAAHAGEGCLRFLGHQGETIPW